MPLDHRTITGTFTARTPDRGDEDLHPDRVTLWGRATLTPQYRVPLVQGGEHIVVRPIDAVIEDGQLLAEVRDGSEVITQPLSLPVTVDDAANQGWSWQVDFHGIRAGQFGESDITLPSMRFPVEPGAEPLDLSELSGTWSGGRLITRGAPGAAVVDAEVLAGEVRFILEDGARTSAVPLPPGPANHLRIGMVAEGAADATIEGDTPEQTLHLTLPRGRKGDPGDKGERGDEGPYGGTEVTDPQVASYIGRSAGTATTAALDQAYRRGFSVEEWGATGDGITDDTLAIQACADAVGAAGGTLFMPPLTFRTTGTVTMDCDVSAVGAVIAFEGAGTALRYGSLVHRIEDRAADLPAVKHTGKTGTGWASVAGSVGVDLCRINTCEVHVPHVAGFETGLLVSAPAGGNVHNTVRIGHLYNNKINQRLTAGPTGWTNQNLFLGGKLSHLSSEGTITAGTAQIKLEHTASLLNNNTWINASLEGDTAEWTIDMEGVENLFVQCRFEVSGGARVRWGASATGNVIFRGYGANTLNQTFALGAAITNRVDSRSTISLAGARVFFENNGSPADAADYVLAPGTVPTIDAAEDAYAVKRSANATRMKRSGDAHDRLVLDHLNGAVRMGNAAAEPAVGVGVAGSALRLDTITRTTAPPAGAAAAVPATPAGYMGVYVGGALRYIPYY